MLTAVPTTSHQLSSSSSERQLASSWAGLLAPKSLRPAEHRAPPSHRSDLESPSSVVSALQQQIAELKQQLATLTTIIQSKNSIAKSDVVPTKPAQPTDSEPTYRKTSSTKRIRNQSSPSAVPAAPPTAVHQSLVNKSTIPSPHQSSHAPNARHDSLEMKQMQSAVASLQSGMSEIRTTLADLTVFTASITQLLNSANTSAASTAASNQL